MVSASRPGACRTASTAAAAFSLVDDDTIEHEILSSRLALAMMDRASWEFSDLRSRINQLERREGSTRTTPAARMCWRASPPPRRAAGLSLEAWRAAGGAARGVRAVRREAYHEINAWLVQRRVMPEVDLRPYIKRSVNSAWVGRPGGGHVHGLPGGTATSATAAWASARRRA